MLSCKLLRKGILQLQCNKMMGITQNLHIKKTSFMKPSNMKFYKYGNPLVTQYKRVAEIVEIKSKVNLKVKSKSLSN